MDFIPLCFSFSCPVKLKPDGQQPTQPLLCPHCNNGALVPFKSRRWFEFCFLPIIPFGSDHIWFCNICSESLSLRYYASLTQSRLASRQEFFHSNTGANALSSTIPAPVSATVLGSKSPCVGLARTIVEMAPVKTLPSEITATAPPEGGLAGVKLFGKWDAQDVEVKDISLTDYIQVRHPVYLPHTAGRYANKQFKKAQMPIVERLVNSLMMNGRNNGKKQLAVRIVQHACEIIHLLTDQNPLQTIVDAVVNTGPREDSTRIGSQGTVRRQAVDVSPLRRVNQAIALLTIGVRESAFRNVKSVSECLADELINASKGSSNSYAIKKKDELERVAKSNR
ncbi:hypothetical protein E3P92_01413 [Wallemia ichthyophaga]|uniref:Small ribosomal subunit protein uS7 domain-containing protein n=3 Tax=Wallemia ichthyophaga TaxID=245174 RepID=A0A4T0JA26_WALIC|nr:hypothetical protein E3P90_01166 [Wallemia ichthyophaga]TIB16119.1 hypothetical protein E3P92_01413 [Wallemia ichthyophaga]TIB16542.1 hypothetical protein E3P93_00917 [Wallemia ichthyophaga]TIB24577.1 hypothetical protein E3P89_00871 [Wallemia ichthyophaga]TIB26482.1 hypothetical protein E3P88_01035 [Wallemia ichthyophaga]